MKYLITLQIVILTFGLFAQEDSLTEGSATSLIPVLWKPLSSNDFTFHEEWSYPMGVYTNPWGQLSCDGLCPKEVDRMKDDQGRIYEDSLEAFYNIVDTTHLYHTIDCEAEMYEFAGTDFIRFKKFQDVLTGVTEGTPSTHASLNIVIDNERCIAWVEYNSILPDRPQMKFPLSAGRIILDPKLYEQGVVKGYFDFRFKNHFEPDFPLHWKGYIYSEIED